jgi:hypothetical protein
MTLNRTFTFAGAPLFRCRREVLIGMAAKLLLLMPLSCFASCKPKSAAHQASLLSTPFRLYGGARRVAPESSLEVATPGLIGLACARVSSLSLTITQLRGAPCQSQ